MKQIQSIPDSLPAKTQQAGIYRVKTMMMNLTHRRNVGVDSHSVRK